MKKSRVDVFHARLDLRAQSQGANVTVRRARVVLKGKSCGKATVWIDGGGGVCELLARVQGAFRRAEGTEASDGEKKMDGFGLARRGLIGAGAAFWRETGVTVGPAFSAPGCGDEHWCRLMFYANILRLVCARRCHAIFLAPWKFGACQLVRLRRVAHHLDASAGVPLHLHLCESRLSFFGNWSTVGGACPAVVRGGG